jgi:hypothetical protein
MTSSPATPTPEPVEPAEPVEPRHPADSARPSHSSETPQPASPDPAGVEAPVAVPVRQRSRYSLGSMPNMLRSLFVIGVFVLVLVAVVPRVSQVDRPAVDALGKARYTAAQTAWPIELPTGLGSGWVPTVATYGPGTANVPTFTTVWSTPGGGTIALKEAVRATDEWVSRSVNDGDRSGTVRLSGRTFERYSADDGKQLSYVVRGAGSGGLTLVVSGTAAEDELKAFTAALRPVRPAG